MNSQTIVMCVVALLLGMLLANMLKSVCGCKTVEALQGNAACWHPESVWTYDYCECDDPAGAGNQNCWDGVDYTYEICCTDSTTDPTQQGCCR